MPSLAYAADSVANFYPARVMIGTEKAFGLLQGSLIPVFFMTIAGIFAGLTLTRQEWDEKIEHGLFVLYFLCAVGLYSAQSNYHAIESPLILSLMDLGLAALVIIGLSATRYFLQLSTRSYLEQIMIVGMVGFTMICALVMILVPQSSALLSSLLLFVPAILSVIVISILSLFQRDRLGYWVLFFAVGWIVLALGITVSALVQASLMPSSFLAAHAFWIGLIIQAIVFTIALMMRQKAYSNSIHQKRAREIQNAMSKERLRKAKESVDQTRLIRVIEREREIMAELRQREMRRTEDMRVARDMADKSNEAKSAFLAVMSHEIRTPLNGIIGTMKLLHETSLSSKQKGLVSAMHESSDSMITLLSDILDFEKIQQGRMDIETIDFDLGSLITSLTTIMQPNAAAKKIELLVEKGGDVPQYVRGDPTRMRQVLTNLLSNAIKFTETGHVALRVEMGEQPMQIRSKPRSKVIFAIEDTGIGISQDNQKNLFKPFQQADKTVARKYGGSGLGLSISKKLVEAMGGNIQLESKEGVGTKFFFALNMDHAEDEAALIGKQEQDAQSDDIIESGDIPPMSILVVDDNALNRKVIASFLTKAGHSVVSSDSGEDAIKRCQAQAFDIIFMDIWMGGISGFETVKMIRALPNHDNHLTPIVAITGSATTDTVERIEKSGIEAYIEKPVNYEVLLQLLQRFSVNRKKATDKAPKGIESRRKTETIQSKKAHVADDKNAPSIYAFLQSEETSENPAAEEPMQEPKQKAEPSAAETSLTVETLPEELFDRTLIKSLADALDLQELKSLLKDYMLKADEIVAALKAATPETSAEDLFARTHEIKGMAANFGMSGVSAIAGNMEKRAQAGDAAAVLSSVNELENSNIKTNEILKQLF